MKYLPPWFAVAILVLLDILIRFTPPLMEPDRVANVTGDTNYLRTPTGSKEEKILTAAESPEKEKLPLQVFPLLKELGAGWGNGQTPPLLNRVAEGKRALIIDVGLDKGDEFFLAIKNGFEVVGFEANPKSHAKLAEKCQAIPTCHAIDIETTPLPLKREAGQSYLLHAAAGNERTTMELAVHGPTSSLVQVGKLKQKEKAVVPVFRVDQVIQEDVFLFKIDTQGFEHYVLEGASKLFENYAVRQVIFEVDPNLMKGAGTTITQTLSMLQTHGIICFSERNDAPGCAYYGDSAHGFEAQFFSEINKFQGYFSSCWEDFLCINTAKMYPGEIPPMM